MGSLIGVVVGGYGDIRDVRVSLVLVLLMVLNWEDVWRKEGML